MAENSAIEWTDHTFNPWVGCTKVGPGCDHCYAESWAKRGGRAAGVTWGGERRRTSDATWRQPARWNAQAQREGRRYRVFCASLADVFDNQVPVQWRRDLFDLIEATPNLDWQLLTKRIGNARRLYAEAYLDSARRWPDNVWLGATVVNQEEADRDIPKLLATPALVRFLSIEPMLGPIDLTLDSLVCTHCQWCADACADPDTGAVENCRRCERTGKSDEWGIDWVICGGESGPGARPMHPDWARSLRDQCEAAGVPFLFKQWGEWRPVSQMDDEFMNRLYKPNRIARLHEDQDALNDCYGRRCTVPQAVIQAEGTVVEPLAPMAFRQGLGSMLTFKVGKTAAGRLLDGVTHDGFPSGEGGA